MKAYLNENIPKNFPKNYFINYKLPKNFILNKVLRDFVDALFHILYYYSTLPSSPNGQMFLLLKVKK